MNEDNAVKVQEVLDLASALEVQAGWLRDNSNLLACRDATRVTAGMVYVWCDDRAQFARAAKRLGTFRKSASDRYFDCTRTFGGLEIQVTIAREKICTRVVKTLVLPATPERVVPARPETTIEDVTYECPESILAEEST